MYHTLELGYPYRPEVLLPEPRFDGDGIAWCVEVKAAHGPVPKVTCKVSARIFSVANRG